MNIAQIEEKIQELVESFNNGSFIYDLLLAYGLPKASITRLQKGDLNLSKKKGEISWKKKLFYREMGTEAQELFPVTHDDLQQTIDSLKKDHKILKHSPRFIIVTDFKNLLAVDTKTTDTIDIKIKELTKHYDFFLPWAGMEKAQHQSENPADVKAAERMAKLYDEIKKENSTKTPEEVHGLNVFLSRLLFCFFAEDTGIFEDGLFVNSISSHTQPDGSDLDGYIEKLFDVLNTKSRKGLPAYLAAFPYVNGGLFRNQHKIPKFTRRSRQAIIESGELDWSSINPDIFGSMIQAVVTPEHRGGLGMHYTSVPNIMKVIGPLFLDDLHEEFERIKNNKPKLEKLLVRLSKIKIFDPACGSGNFLIVAYKELRKLEMKIIKQLNRLALSGIHLSQFYGIEIDDFAHEVAVLSLWLAEHQMNVEFFKEFGRMEPTLPLKDAGNIVRGNACRVDWEEVCPKKEDDEIYILGNPPYLGGKGQSKEQKNDMEFVFNGYTNFKELDYIGCWFLVASKYVDSTSRFAFVTTSSICQGSQVEQLWPIIFNAGLEILFAYKPFIWSNNAKSNAGVACSIIGVGRQSGCAKHIYNDSIKHVVNHINAYLMNGPDMIIEKCLKPISDLPPVITGNSPYENGNLMLTRPEMDTILKNFPIAKPLFRRLNGADEFLNSIERFCLWIDDEMLKLAVSIPLVAERIHKTKEFRLKGGEVARGIANRPHQFRYTHSARKSQIIIPIVSSERREYIPIGFLPKEYIIISSAAAIYDCESYIFGIVSSKMHMVWVKMTAGRLENRLRYLSALCYNTFPFPKITEEQKQRINQSVLTLIEEREKHSEKTPAQLYDPNLMPSGLRQAHHQLDLAVERCYRSKPFTSDEERLEYLFKLYEQMIAEEKQTTGELSLFDEPAIPKKTKGKKHA